MDQLFSSGGRNAVILRPTVVFRCTPERNDQSLIFEAVEGGIERAVLDLQNVTRRLLDRMRDRVAVRRRRANGPQNKHVQRPLHHIAGLLVFRFSRHMPRKLTPEDNLWERDCRKYRTAALLNRHFLMSIYGTGMRKKVGKSKIFSNREHRRLHKSAM